MHSDACKYVPNVVLPGELEHFLKRLEAIVATDGVLLEVAQMRVRCHNDLERVFWIWFAL
jgi:hypothetical protein